MSGVISNHNIFALPHSAPTAPGLPRVPAQRPGHALQPRPPPRARRQRCQRGRELRGSALLGRETGRGEAQGSSQVRYRAASILQVL